MARDLLERWNTEDVLDPYQPGRRTTIPQQATSEPDAEEELSGDYEQTEAVDPQVAAASSELSPLAKRPNADVPTATEREARVARRPSQRTFRVDAGHKSTASDDAARHPHEPRDVDHSHGARVDASHASAPAPHFSIDSAFNPRRKPGRGESIWGQLLAYAGVGVLTVGTGLVVWGYFGGPDSYTPTGWLLATAGQMLLFLGVVTLISGGMELTTHEVTQRIERLGEHIIRIERHTSEHSLRGPHFDTGNPQQTKSKTTVEKSA